MFQQIFRCLEPCGQFLANRLFDYAASGERQCCAGFGNVDVAQQRIACHNAARCRVSQHNDVGQTSLFQHRQPCGHSRHLHQAQYALLHPRAARCCEDNVRAFSCYRAFDGVDKRFTNRHAHRSAHEGEVLNADDRGLAVDFALGRDHRVWLPGGSPRGFDSVGVFFGVFELQRVFADGRRGQDSEAVVIEHGGKAFGRADASVMIAFGADRLVFLIFLEEHHRVAALALVPERFRSLALGDERNGVAYSSDPVHFS